VGIKKYIKIKKMNRKSALISATKGEM
jgi:hypothetical protein